MGSESESVPESVSCNVNILTVPVKLHCVNGAVDFDEWNGFDITQSVAYFNNVTLQAT